MLKSSTAPKLRLAIILMIALLYLFLSARVGLSQAPTPSDDEVNRIASQLYCPICDNVSLDVCPLDACRQWRDLIREQLADGWTEREIKDYFIAQYGDRVSGEPPRSGLNWVLYLAPPILIISAFALLVLKMKRPSTEIPTPEIDPEDHHIEQVERDLRKLK